MKKPTYQINKVLNKWEEDNYRKVMEKKILAAKSTLPFAKGSAKTKKGPSKAAQTPGSTVDNQTAPSTGLGLDGIIFDEVKTLVKLLNARTGQKENESPSSTLKKDKIPQKQKRPPFWLPGEPEPSPSHKLNDGNQGPLTNKLTHISTPRVLLKQTSSLKRREEAPTTPPKAGFSVKLSPQDPGRPASSRYTASPTRGSPPHASPFGDPEHMKGSPPPTSGLSPRKKQPAAAPPVQQPCGQAVLADPQFLDDFEDYDGCIGVSPRVANEKPTIRSLTTDPAALCASLATLRCLVQAKLSEVMEHDEDCAPCAGSRPDSPQPYRSESPACLRTTRSEGTYQNVLTSNASSHVLSALCSADFNYLRMADCIASAGVEHPDVVHLDQQGGDWGDMRPWDEELEIAPGTFVHEYGAAPNNLLQRLPTTSGTKTEQNGRTSTQPQQSAGATLSHGPTQGGQGPNNPTGSTATAVGVVGFTPDLPLNAAGNGCIGFRPDFLVGPAATAVGGTGVKPGILGVSAARAGTGPPAPVQMAANIAHEAAALFGSLRQLHQLMSEQGKELHPSEHHAPSKGLGFIYEEPVKPPALEPVCEESFDVAEHKELSPNDVEWMCRLMSHLTRSLPNDLLLQQC